LVEYLYIVYWINYFEIKYFKHY